MLDEQGRRRFHGAFTGGFSAGYFNSVGSAEGWKPSTFVSSRDARASKAQRVEDFMDDEDLEALRAGQDLRTKEAADDDAGFSAAAKGKAKERASYLDDECVHGAPVFRVMRVGFVWLTPGALPLVSPDVRALGCPACSARRSHARRRPRPRPLASAPLAPLTRRW